MKQASISFNHAADFYDATRALPEGLARDLMAALVRELRAVGAPQVLEVGVGTGRIARPLAAHGFRVCGIDIAPRMLTRLRKQLGPEHVEPDLLLGDATRLPLAAGSFDAAVLCHVLHLIPPWQDAVEEMRRVLKPGGLLLHHGDHSVGEGDWDAAYLKWIELFTERGFVRRVRPKIEDMNAAFAAVGGEYHTETIAEWDDPRPRLPRSSKWPATSCIRGRGRFQTTSSRSACRRSSAGQPSTTAGWTRSFIASWRITCRYGSSHDRESGHSSSRSFSRIVIPEYFRI